MKNVNFAEKNIENDFLTSFYNNKKETGFFDKDKGKYGKYTDGNSRFYRFDWVFYTVIPNDLTLYQLDDENEKNEYDKLYKKEIDRYNEFKMLQKNENTVEENTDVNTDPVNNDVNNDVINEEGGKRRRTRKKHKRHTKKKHKHQSRKKIKRQSRKK